MGYLGVESPGKWIYLGGGVLTALLHLVMVLYLASSQHRRITTYEFEFPQLVDEARNFNELNICHCFCGRVIGGWPATRLNSANMIQVGTGVLTTLCIGAQACVSAESNHDLNAMAAYGYVFFAIVHLSTALRMQLTLNVIPSQDVRMPPHGTTDHESGERQPREDYYIPYSFGQLPMRLQLKLILGLLSTLCVVTYAVFEFTDLFSSSDRQWVLPICQYAAILFYFCAYCTFRHDIRTSGIVWHDWNFLENRWRERLINKRIVMREQSLRASAERTVSPIAVPESNLTTYDFSRSCGVFGGGTDTQAADISVALQAQHEAHFGNLDPEVAEAQIEMQGGNCAMPSGRDCELGPSGCSVQ